MATLKLRKAKTAEFAAELERAEGEFNGGVSAEGSDGYVYLKVTEVELRPLLFQPRGPAFGTRDIDRDCPSSEILRQRAAQIKGGSGSFG